MDILKKIKDWQERSVEDQEKTDLYVKLYRIKRSLEFMEQYNSTEAWESIQRRRIRRKTLRILSLSSGVAAAFLVLLGITYFMSYYIPGKDELRRTETIACSFPEKGTKKAILQLNNGEEINLTTEDGTIQADAGTVAVSKSGESLSYIRGESRYEDSSVQFNTLKVPRGGEYQLVLEDGTKVWLNAESSLRYPTRFVKHREVTLVGEGYFEVNKDKDRPFIVKVGMNKVEVLGTKFNVSAYSGSNVCTTLAEGCVKVYSNHSSVMLSPNNQAIISETGNIKVNPVDASLYISWAQGVYEFRQIPLKDIVSQLSRWYDVDIVFKEESLGEKKFAGAIFRKDDLSFAIEIIEKVSNVKFVREGTTIYITENK